MKAVALVGKPGDENSDSVGCRVRTVEAIERDPSLSQRVGQ